jgi:hypothetical protein
MYSTIFEEDLKLKIPFGCMIGGPSSSGKSELVYKILDNAENLFSPKPKAILYSYGEYNTMVPKLESKGFHISSGMPSDELIARLPRPFLWVMDDMLTMISEKTISELFTKKNHHKNFGSIFITQNIFEKSLRIARQNSQYIFLTRAPNFLLSIRNLGVQLFPRNLNYFLDAYEKACSKLYGYLLIDMHASSNSFLKLRTNIFPGEERCIFTPINKL